MGGFEINDVGAAGGLPMIICGLIALFFGLKLFKCILFVNGFIIGALIGGGLGFVATNNSGVAAIAGLVVGIIGGYVGMMLRKLAYFLFGAILGFSAACAIGFILVPSLSHGNQLIGILGGGALLGGIIACFIGDFIVILCTAALGSLGTTCGTLALFAMNPTNGGVKVFLLAELAGLLALGIWYQLKRREEWKGALEIHNTTIINTTVNTNISNNNTVEVLIQPPQAQQYPMIAMTPYPSQQQYGQPQQSFSPYPPQQYNQPQQEFVKPQAV